MRYSQGRINQVSKKITEALYENDMIDNPEADAEEIRFSIAKILSEEFSIEEQVDDEVRKIISSYSRMIIEGSREWDILYRKHYEEQMSKRRRF